MPGMHANDADVANGLTPGLTLVGTPIGNMGDLSPRAQEALAQADVILAEDTRVAGRLLACCGIRSKRLERCDENVIEERAQGLVERMLGGECMAFVSDAGMPAVADPGARLVDACRKAGVEVDVIPGPSAVTCAIAQAGFSCEAFYFGGFLPRKDAARERLLASLAQLPAVLVFYESPHRCGASLEAIARAFPQRSVALARELTKLHQEVVRAGSAEVARTIAERPDLKGEVVIVVDAPGREETKQAAAREGERALAGLDEAIRSGLDQGAAKSALARDLAAQRGLAKKQVYERILEIDRERNGETCS